MLIPGTAPLPRAAASLLFLTVMFFQGYSVAFDPLDGSSIIDTNFAVGTIFGIWPGNRLVGISGRELAGAGMAVYGPRTTMTVACETFISLLIDEASLWIFASIGPSASPCRAFESPLGLDCSLAFCLFFASVHPVY